MTFECLGATGILPLLPLAALALGGTAGLSSSVVPGAMGNLVHFVEPSTA